MAENSFINSINCARQKVKGIEEKNHYVSNILMVASLCLIILFTLLSGANVNVGSTYKGDNEDIYVRQSFFKLADAALNSSMDEDEALAYVLKVGDKLNSYGILAPSTGISLDDNVKDEPFHSLDFTSLLEDAKNKMGNKVNGINWIKYKYALSVVLANTASDVHKSSWDGHVAVMLAGQSIFETLIRLAIIVISIIMLVFAVIALVKRKKFAKAKFTFSLLLVCFFASLIFRFGFIKPDALMILTLVLIPLTSVLYALLAHAVMENSDFSITMLLHNGVLLLGSALAFIFMTVCVFKVTNNYGVSQSYGWNFLFDLLIGEGAYMTVPMSYFLITFIMSLLLMMNVILCAAIIISLINRFLTANYQHNDKKSILIGAGVYGFIVALIVGISSANGSLRITSLSLNAKINVAFLVLQLLIFAGLIVFSYLFKPKAIKKEFVMKGMPGVQAAPQSKPANTESQNTENKESIESKEK